MAGNSGMYRPGVGAGIRKGKTPEEKANDRGEVMPDTGGAVRQPASGRFEARGIRMQGHRPFGAEGGRSGDFFCVQPVLRCVCGGWG